MNNFQMMKKRLEAMGGIKQEDRMIKGKLDTLKRSLFFSYQGCDIRKIQSYDSCALVEDMPTDLDIGVLPFNRALINADKNKQDYDDKILSVEYNQNYHTGDIFQWVGTNTYWLIYLQQLTEDAYFRGEIRRCRYIIKFKDKDGNPRYTWAAVRGPIETQIDSIQKNQVRINNPNLSLSILIPSNKYTRATFDRYYRFLLEGRAWRVTTINTLSTPDIIEMTAVEYYIDDEKDDQVIELAEGLVVEPVDPNPVEDIQIKGPIFIRPQMVERYEAPSIGTWSVKEKFPVQLNSVSDNEVDVKWLKAVSGQFTLVWTDGTDTLEKIIVVESLF